MFEGLSGLWARPTRGRAGDRSSVLGDAFEEASAHLGEVDARSAFVEAAGGGGDGGSGRAAGDGEGFGVGEADEGFALFEAAERFEEIHPALRGGHGAVDFVLCEEREREDAHSVGARGRRAREDADGASRLELGGVGLAGEEENPREVGACAALHPRVALGDERGDGVGFDALGALEVAGVREGESEVVLGDGADLREAERVGGFERLAIRGALVASSKAPSSRLAKPTLTRALQPPRRRSPAASNAAAEVRIRTR